MKDFYDLHTHSQWSDGDFSPAKLVHAAEKQGLAGLALTDHDSILGWEEFSRAAAKLRLETIQGVEFSSKLYGVGLHIVGYSQRFNIGALAPLLRKTSRIAFEYTKKIADRLRKGGIADIDVRELRRKKGEEAALTGYDLQKELLYKFGISIGKSRLLFHERDGLAYVPYDERPLSHPRTIINYIHKANGLAVLAHPGKVERSIKRQSDTEKTVWLIIEELLGYGLDGLEAYSPRHTAEQERAFSKLIKERGLIKTGGSDFHGPVHQPDISLGDRGVGPQLWRQLLKRLPR